LIQLVLRYSTCDSSSFLATKLGELHAFMGD